MSDVKGKPVESTAHDHLCQCRVCRARYRPIRCSGARCWLDRKTDRCIYGGPFKECEERP